MNALKNSFWYLFFNLLRLFVVFFGTMWVSRVLGPDVFGEFSYYLSIIVYFSTIDAMCHESIVKQYLSSNSDTGLILGTSSFLNFLLSLVAIASICLFGFYFINGKPQMLIFLLFIPGQLNKLFNPIANLFDIKLLSKFSSLALFVGAAFSILFRVSSLKFTNDLLYQSIGYSMQTLVYGGVLYYFYFKKDFKFNLKISFNLFFEIIKKSFPIFLSSLIFLSLSVSDIFMIRNFLDLREVGIYSVVVKLCEPWVIVSTALCTSYFPLIFKYGDKLAKQNKIFIYLNQLSIVFIGALGLILSLSIELIVFILLGEKYQEVSGVFRIYFWSILFLFFANIQHIWEVYNKKYSLALYKTSIAFLLKISLNFLLGSRYGLKGFAFATLISFGFYGVLFNLFSSSTRSYLKLQLSSLKLEEFKKNYRFIRFKGSRWLKKEY